MIEPVEKKIQEINLKKKKALRKQKDQNLLRWGFDGKRKNKNDIPLILTDEEYNAILEAEKSYSGAVKSDKNPLANLLFVMAVAAVVIGIVQRGAVLCRKIVGCLKVLIIRGKFLCRGLMIARSAAGEDRQGSNHKCQNNKN